MKGRNFSLLVILIIGILLLVGCNKPTEVVSTPITEKTGGHIANPASVYCEKRGYQIVMRTVADGSQSGVCIFPDGSECDEWAFFRGECGPDEATPMLENKAIEAAKIVLAKQLNVDTSQITLFTLERIIWADSCLGIPGLGETCDIVETPGFRVILVVGEDQFTYHTNMTGENIRQEIAGGHPATD